MKKQFDWIVHKLLRGVNNVNTEKGIEKGTNGRIGEREITLESGGRSQGKQQGIPIGRRFCIGSNSHHQHWRGGICRNQYMCT